MKSSTFVARLEGSRPRETSRRLIFEVLLWVAAFSLLLCQPADRSRAGTAAPDRVHVSESR